MNYIQVDLMTIIIIFHVCVGYSKSLQILHLQVAE